MRRFTLFAVFLAISSDRATPLVVRYSPTLNQSFDHVPSNFGGGKSLDMTTPLLYSPSANGCEEGSKVFDKFPDGGALLLVRGECTFADKIIWAQSINASAVIVFDSEARPGTGTGWGVIMSSDVPHAAIRIPAVFVSFESGMALKELCLNPGAENDCFLTINSVGDALLSSQVRTSTWVWPLISPNARATLLYRSGSYNFSNYSHFPVPRS